MLFFWGGGGGRTFTLGAGITLEAHWQCGAISVGVAEDVGGNAGVGLQTYDQPQVRQVHPRRHLATFVSGLQHQSQRKHTTTKQKDKINYC